jgi:hypothetical protein
MLRFIEELIAHWWNWLQRRRDERSAFSKGTMLLGYRVIEDRATDQRVTISQTRRTMHVGIVGKTGTGKSSFLKVLCLQDIAAGRGFFFLDLHGDATPFLLRAIAAEERRRGVDLSDRLIVIAPSDSEASVGLNPLENREPDFAKVAETAEVLRQRWGLDRFGPRTDELLRNGLFVLSANALTLLELAPLLADAGFRAPLLKNVQNAEVRSYFESRYGAASPQMQAVMREAILNKTSSFTGDARFRHIVGQPESTFSFRQAMDEGMWIIAQLEKGRHGAQALTLASLLFTMAKNAIFARERTTPFVMYLDELQNLVSQSTDVETVLSEARKFGVGICAANQYLDQYPVSMRAAILSVRTHAFFQLSSADAGNVSQMLDGGRSLAERLKNLPQRHFVVKSGSEPWREVVVPKVNDPGGSYADLLRRSRALHARPRAEIERDIAVRQQQLTANPKEALHDWE